MAHGEGVLMIRINGKIRRIDSCKIEYDSCDVWFAKDGGFDVSLHCPEI